MLEVTCRKEECRKMEVNQRHQSPLAIAGAYLRRNRADNKGQPRQQAQCWRMAMKQCRQSPLRIAGE